MKCVKALFEDPFDICIVIEAIRVTGLQAQLLI